MQFRRFDDFHIRGASDPAWNQRYQQLSCGAMRSSLIEAAADPLHVFRKCLSQRVVQQDSLPSGRICFALSIGRATGTPRMQGYEMHPDHLFVLRGGEEFVLQRPARLELLAVTFEREVFERLLDARPWTAGARGLLSRTALRGPAPLVQCLRRELLALLSRSDPNDGFDGALAVFEALGNVFAGAAQARRGGGCATASFIVAECQRIVEGSGAEPPSVEALCRRLHTSRRTLQNSFRQVADRTPVHYLRSVRLNALRRRLMSTRPADLSIAQAATDLGFEHLSHASQRYAALFGELPSRTPRRPHAG